MSRIPPPPLAPPTPYIKKPGDLFLAVLPLVHYSRHFAGVSYEEVMTLVPERSFATEFPPDLADTYINTFREAAEEKFGGPVRRYNYSKHETETGNGRVFVVVNQYGNLYG
jgi:hypothetical protein